MYKDAYTVWMILKDMEGAPTDDDARLFFSQLLQQLRLLQVHLTGGHCLVDSGTLASHRSERTIEHGELFPPTRFAVVYLIEFFLRHLEFFGNGLSHFLIDDLHSQALGK